MVVENLPTTFWTTLDNKQPPFVEVTKGGVFVLQYDCNFSRRQIEQHDFEELLISIVRSYLLVIFYHIFYLHQCLVKLPELEPISPKVKKGAGNACIIGRYLPFLQPFCLQIGSVQKHQ